MSQHDEHTLRMRAAEYGQEQVFRFWERLDGDARSRLLADVAAIDFPLMQRLVDTWVKDEPAPEHFDDIAPVPTYPIADDADPEAQAAREAGETALRAGRVGIVLVAGGQGTRLGFDGPKGAYPIGPLTGKTLFAYHAEKIANLQETYGCTLPWFIMVSDANRAATEAFFHQQAYFGLDPAHVFFFQQRMVPCVDTGGRFLLAAPGGLAKNPNGHGGCLPALVESGLLDEAAARGVDTLSYFQVDNWAAKVADPHFIGYHLLGNGEMSSKVHRKREPRESVGVHVLCDGKYRVIEYSELDLYPQLLETDAAGNVKCYAGNPAMHILDTAFVRRVVDNYDQFPWHRAHKKVPHVDKAGQPVQPDAPNAYKFETFIFDALRWTQHRPIALEIRARGEYTPTKQWDGPNSVVAARASMNEYWAEWFDAAGTPVPRNQGGACAVDLEVSPRYARTADQFLAKARGRTWPLGEGGLSVDADGRPHTHTSAEA